MDRLEEIIKTLETCAEASEQEGYRHIPVNLRIASQLLRVGIEMRSNYILPGHPKCPEGMIALFDYRTACEKWDAALNGGEG